MAYNFTVKIINYLPRLFSRLESRVKKKTGVVWQVRCGARGSRVTWGPSCVSRPLGRSGLAGPFGQ